MQLFQNKNDWSLVLNGWVTAWQGKPHSHMPSFWRIPSTAQGIEIIQVIHHALRRGTWKAREIADSQSQTFSIHPRHLDFK